ncbi:helix-turn-helix domain-containing protein [Neoaquamicrobium sediminum]|uniref:helix-turn-helix domain-containing protein n=1 Tax=Neoaquamicrobium sediminum TaxID=1849104 RepID=UPI00156739D3|nr:helix-turn-helix domain-containing protein [Mesorhizobium sediminum]NRC54202.1 helix-turn-helix domain-containing protein [Mesorhizobium sediminum]
MSRPKTANNPIIEKALARRIEEACNLADHIPEYNFGRIRWMVDELAKHGVTASKESVRKWFAGESRPRPDKLRILAKILKVDEAWLAFGSKPAMTTEKEQLANVDGAVNLVAGLFAMNGINYGWANGKDNVHFHAIVKGQSRAIFVASGTVTKSGVTFALPIQSEESIIIGVVKRGMLSYDLYRLPYAMISKSGLSKGGYVELTATDHGDWLLASGNRAPKLSDLAELDQ